MQENPILIEQRAGYRVITLNRPQRLNAFNDAMQQQLLAAVTDAERRSSFELNVNAIESLFAGSA